MNLFPMLAAIGAATFIITCAGGLLALRLRKHLSMLLGFSAGTVVAVAFLELLPEGFELARASVSQATLVACAAGGFAFYFAVDRLLFRLPNLNARERANKRSMLFTCTLILHSCMDGVAIGLGMKVSVSLGAVVAIAVLTHDFCDGINTMNLAMRGERTAPLAWLVADATAPTLGILSTLLFVVPNAALGVLLAGLAGMFAYIAFAELLPSSYRAKPGWTAVSAMALGMACMCLVVVVSRAH